MEKVRVRLVLTEHTAKKQETSHGAHFRDFVQIMLCHAWIIGMLEAELWSDIPDIAEASALHDIGKNVMPPRLVNKKDELTNKDHKEMEQHTILGALCVDQIIPELRGEDVYDYAQKICFHHHERINGRGYPLGLCGDEIPTYVQIVSLADVYDALRSDRSYRKAIPPEKAARMIYDEECGAFDPDLFDAFEPHLEEFRKMPLMLTDDPHRMESIQQRNIRKDSRR